VVRPPPSVAAGSVVALRTHPAGFLLATGGLRVEHRADGRAQLAGPLGALPLYDWMIVTVTRLEPHPNDPLPTRPSPQPLGDSNDQ
jgi:hypothetical protein